MRASLECIPCLIRQSLDACKLVVEDAELQSEIMKKVLRSVAEFDMNLTPPEMAQKIHRIIKKETGCDDLYFKIKENSTDIALRISKDFDIVKSEYPFEKAVRFAIAGNIIDFGVKSTCSDEYIKASFDKAEHIDIDSVMIRKLYDEIAEAETVLVLADNAGEAVFDKLLIETFPGNAEVIYAVKGKPILNDVTQYEAEKSQINSVATIISNGTDVPGTALNQCTPEFVEQFNNADVIIAKGQGNFESLNENEKKVYFLFQVKCSVIADHYNYKLGDWMVTNSEVTRSFYENNNFS
jgi:damage-control phosphatase, subfamily I